LPFDDQFVTYVWFDALINYLTGIGYPDGADFGRYWGGAEHVIAKDILKPHAIFWPTMLKSMGLEPYRKLHVHGYWNINDTKMSKSIGNVVRPADLVKEYGVDAVRYFLLREMSFGLDSSFSAEALLTRQNADLANDLGNLFSRSLTMVTNFCADKVPVSGPPAESDRELAAAAAAMVGEYTKQMQDFAFNRALREIWKVIGLANRYIVSNAPWELAKDPGQRARLDTVLYTLLETLRLITLTLHPIMPATAAKMAAALGLTAAPNLAAQGAWGLLPAAAVITPGPALFPRLAKKGGPTGAGTAKPAAKTAGPADSPANEGLISFDQFQEVDLRVAEITGAEKIKKSDRLLKLTVNAPEERTIVAGLAEFYAPEDLLGKRVIIAANLKPVKLMGVISHGMVLAARDGDKLALATVDGLARPGSRVA
jgi:methionyl-tRNA synthetase